MEYIIQGQKATARMACEQHKMNGYLENACSMLLSVKIVLDKSLAIFRTDMRRAKNTSRGVNFVGANSISFASAQRAKAHSFRCSSSSKLKHRFNFEKDVLPESLSSAACGAAPYSGKEGRHPFAEEADSQSPSIRVPKPGWVSRKALVPSSMAQPVKLTWELSSTWRKSPPRFSKAHSRKSAEV